MSFRRRLVLSCGAAVALVVVLGCGLAYWVVRDTLRAEIDNALRNEVVQRGAPGPGELGTSVSIRRGDLLTEAPPAFVTEIRRHRGRDRGPLRAARRRRGPARRRGRPQEPFFADRQLDGVHVRVHVARLGNLTLFVARPLTEVDSALNTLRNALLLLALGGIGLAVILSRLAMRAAVRPVAELTDTAEHVASTRDLTRRIDAHGDDEVARLATAFNTMLEALERSQRAQKQLVADASHELRTPLTSLRTNLEVLARGGPLEQGDRERLREDLVLQLEELTGLVGDLTELARDEEPEIEDVRLDALVAGAVERARRHAPHITYAAELEPTLVSGVPGRLDRAVGNLLDNAAKYSPAGSVVDVRLRDGELTVRDHGPGHPGGRPRARLRPLLPGGHRARAARARGSAWRSCGRWRRRTAGRWPRRPPTAAARSAAAPAGLLSNFLGSENGRLSRARERGGHEHSFRSRRRRGDRLLRRRLRWRGGDAHAARRRQEQAGDARLRRAACARTGSTCPTRSSRAGA